MLMNVCGRKMWSVVCAALVCGGVAARAEPTVDEEFEFASGLISFEPRFIDFAQRVVDAVLLRDPSQKDRSQMIQAEILIAGGKLVDAEKIIADLGANNPKAQAASLVLAQNYYRKGETQKARELYEKFFNIYKDKKPTDTDLLRLYQNSAYQFAQMLEHMGALKEAAEAYKRVEAAVDGDTRLNMQVRRAQMLVEASKSLSGGEKDKLLDEALAICKEVQWAGLGLPFVESIILMAEVDLARGKPAQAQKTLQEYMDMIRPVDDMMKEMGLPLKDSPMASARSLLGALYRTEADGLAKQNKDEEAIAAYGKALGEYYNVFMKYKDSPKGPTAGIISREISEILSSKYGKQVNIDFSQVGSDVAAGAEFKMGDTLFSQKEYQKAAEEYLTVLARFPEAGELSIRAVANLSQCYFHLNDPLYAKMTANYLGERFGHGSSAVPAQALVALGKMYEDAGNAEVSNYLYDRYLKYCPTDSRAGQILYYLASKEERAGNQELADKYYARIIAEFPNDQFYAQALSKRAWKAYTNKDYEGSIAGMIQYLEGAQPSMGRAQGLFALADSYQQTKNYAEAVRQFNTLIKALSQPNTPYVRNQADIAAKEQLLEQARFRFALGLSQIPNNDKMKLAAISQADEFLKLYPQSGLASKAMNMKAGLQMALNDPAANETYTELARKYPNTEEGKYAQYARVSGALDLGRFDQARDAVNAMVAAGGRYSPAEFTRVGEAMLDKSQWEGAIVAFEQVINSGTEEREYLERAYYGLGAAQYELGDYAAAIKNMNELMTRWPRSALFFDAKFILARSNTKEGDLEAAKIALNDVFRGASSSDPARNNPVLMNDASLDLANIYLLEDNKSSALLAYKRLEWLDEPKDDRTRKQIETAILAAINLGMDMERYPDVLESADRYQEFFPTSPRLSDVRRKRAEAAVKASMMEQ